MSEKIKLKCKYCGHEWEYTGKSKYYVTCPVCHYKLSIKKARAEK